ncbi:MAG: DUF4199 domain-containing protein [Gemmatimonadetes bacterium]|jgi:hypothetical protein|nr:DUF4199 domain-containing protein [Gemmatimonadota bacterium]
MRKIVLTFGLIAGTIMSAMLLIAMPFQEQIGPEKGMIIGYTSMVLAFLMIFVGVKTYRDNVAGGRITFGRAFLVGFLIMFVASSCYVATWEVMYFKLTPGYSEKMTAQAIEKERKSGANEAQLAAKRKEMEEFQAMYQKPLVNIAITFLEPLPVGLLFALIAAGVMSRKRRDDEALSGAATPRTAPTA